MVTPHQVISAVISCLSGPTFSYVMGRLFEGFSNFTKRLSICHLMMMTVG